jgi:hypothetical protein
MTPPAVEEHPAAASDYVNLISVMGLLRIAALRSIQLHFKRSVRKDRYGQIPGWWWPF